MTNIHTLDEPLSLDCIVITATTGIFSKYIHAWKRKIGIYVSTIQQPLSYLSGRDELVELSTPLFMLSLRLGVGGGTFLLSPKNAIQNLFCTCDSWTSVW